MKHTTCDMEKKRSAYPALFLAAILFAVPGGAGAQSSPLTIQPSTGRVGVNTSTPGYTLDVSGTVNAATFRGDGSQLTNLPGAGGNGAYGSRGQSSRNTPGFAATQFDLKADVVILGRASDQSTVTRYNAGTITNNTGLAGPAINGRD